MLLSPMLSLASHSERPHRRGPLAAEISWQLNAGFRCAQAL